MLAILSAALTLLAPGSFAPGPDPDAVSSSPEALVERARARPDPCRDRDGWVGDGDDGRDPPTCDALDPDGSADPAGLHEPGWLDGGEDEDPDGPQLR